METLLFFNTFILYTFLNILSFFVFTKVTNYEILNANKIVVAFFSSITLGLFSAILVDYISLLTMFLIFYLSQSLIIFILLKNSTIEYIMLSTLISMGISYIVYTISLLLSSILIGLPFYQHLSPDSPIPFVVAVCFALFFIYRMFKIRRFQNGFYFLHDTNKISNVGIIGFILSGIILVVYSNLRGIQNLRLFETILSSIALIAICIFIWIRRTTTLTYNNTLKEQAILSLEKELEVEKKKNEKLCGELSLLASVNHEYKHKLLATDLYLQKLKSTNVYSTEFADELSAFSDLVNSMSNSFSSRVNENIKYYKPLPKTNILGLDNSISYFQHSCVENDIDFNMLVNCSVKDLSSNHISSSKLETLVNDHLSNAVISINASSSPCRKICLIFDIKDNCYEVSVFDSGIEFEVSTLSKLGVERVTTHGSNGGSGIGFMTTFETLGSCKASLIIEELLPNTSIFTKSINFLFDGNSNYIIRSYRSDELSSHIRNSRIIIEK